MRNCFTLILILSSLISVGQNPTIEDLWKLYNSHDFKSVIEKVKPLLINEPNNLDLNSTKNATNDAYGKSLLFGFDGFYKNWKIVETDNFRFHFQNMNDAEIEKYITLRERAYKKINDFFKSKLPKKIDFYVWESKEDAKKILRKNLGFANPDFCIVHTHYQQTIPGVL